MSKISKHLFVGTRHESDFHFFREKSSKLPLMCYHNFPVEFFPIVSLFAEDCDFNICELYADEGRLFIKGRNRKRKGAKTNDFMLRYGDKRLVVARVQFVNQRQGNMSKLYLYLKAIRKRYKLDKIIIECCNTEGMRNWCVNNGFVRMIGNSYIEK